jgi:NADP-dependent 3-hydroxy acid dehydrogenase YdfG
MAPGARFLRATFGKIAMGISGQTVAVVTGASSGIGLATAHALARKGARTALLARSSSRLERASDQVRAIGAADAASIACDVRNEDQVESAIKTIVERWGRVDILINNAGLSLNGPLDGYALSDWRTVIDTNLTGTFLMCRAVIPVMKRQGGGQIINVASGAGRNGIANMAPYCASKFGVIGLTEALGLEVRNQNIRVSSVLPGSVATAFSRTANRESQSEEATEERTEERTEEIGYKLTPDEVARVIISMLEQPTQAWMSEVILRPLNLELRRKA